MKLTSLLVAALALAFAALALAAPARAGTFFVDQQDTVAADNYAYLPGTGTVGQSFVPNAASMNTATFTLTVGDDEGEDSGESAHLSAQILAGPGLGGTVLGQSNTVVVPATDATGTVTFQFPADVALTPGSTYTLALTYDSTNSHDVFVNIGATTADTYASGQAYVPDNTYLPAADLDFQEGIAYPATVTTVHSFTGSGDGEYTEAGLIQANDGNLYGTTQEGGANGDGTVFMVSTDGTTFQTLHAFDYNGGGIFPVAGLLQGSDGNLYGTTKSDSTNANGTVFKVSTDGTTFQTLHFFTDTDGQSPQSVLIQGSDGYLYGTTYFGGANDDGTVFKVSTDGTTFQTLHSFNGTDGEHPFAGLLQASDGNLYGTTAQGGAVGLGSVFKVSTDGTAFQTVYSFDVSDAFAGAALIQAGDGYLYGTAEGSVHNDGTVFKVSTDGKTFQRLHTFTGADGNSPVAGLLLASDGNLYGTTYNGGANDAGTAFMVSTDGATFETLYGFGSVSGDGNILPAGLIQAGDGNLYGTAYQGGANGYGEVYELPVSLPAVIQFHMAINSVNETAGTATIRVDRIGDEKDAVFFSYATADGTAKAGTDYQSQSGTDVFNVTQTTPVFITVPIINRGFTDGSLRTLTITLSNLYPEYQTAISLGFPATATLTINGSIPGAPVITSAQTATGIEGVPFSYQIVASATPTTYGFQGDPNGLSIDPKTGLISGTPKAAHGALSYTLNAYNKAGKGSAPLTITFSQATPTITSALTADATANAPFSYQITASGGDPQRFGVTGLPAGLSVDPSTGIISGTRKVPGPVTMSLNAFNSAGMGSASLTINVAAEAVPAITSATTASATAGQPFTYTITASNNPTSFGAQSLPAGLSVDANTGVISGTRKVPGTVTLTLNAYNSTGKGSAMLTLTVQ